MPIIQPVILCGGSGARLWPVSRSMYPKQFLSLTGSHTMLQDTFRRLDDLSNLSDQTIVVCNEAHRFLVAEQLALIGQKADIILEPEGRNTAPAIALAAIHALRQPAGDNVRNLLVMPADHHIESRQLFHAAIQKALTSSEQGNFVTFGIVPINPNTGYGYIEADPHQSSAVQIKSFVEKPDFETALAFVKSGKHFWNSGIFLFRADRYLEELQSFSPEIVNTCQAAMDAASSDKDFIRPDNELFIRCPDDSIDYALMEKTRFAEMVQLNAGWSDVGSWEALYAISDKDDSGNVIKGDVLTHECKDSIISSESRLVTAVGIQHLTIVETRDAVLVADTRKSQSVRDLVAKLKHHEREETALHRQVVRPWGSYDSLENEDGFQVKRLVVKPGATLSLQMHHRRAEHWVVVRGTARITLNDEEFDLGVNESTFIPIGARHRIANRGTEAVHIIEVQCGDYLGEDDIVRFEDDYGREGTNT